MLGAQGAPGGSVASLEFEYRVKVVWPHRHVVGFPAEERVIETLGGGLVRGMELNPTKRASGMLVDVCHSGESLHQVGAAGCERAMNAT